MAVQNGQGAGSDEKRSKVVDYLSKDLVLRTVQCDVLTAWQTAINLDSRRAMEVCTRSPGQR